MQNLDRIFSSARSDVRLQNIITNYLIRDGFKQNLVLGLTFGEQRNDPPAFTLGLQTLQLPIGAIYVSESFMRK